MKLVYSFGIWWAIAMFLLFLQGWFMGRSLLFLGLAILAPLLWLYFWYQVVRSLGRKKWPRYTIYAIAGLHAVPLLLQLLGIATPRWENVLLAAISLPVLMIRKEKKKKN